MLPIFDGVDNKKIVDALVALEEIGATKSFICKGVNYWPLIRISLAFGTIACRYPKNRRRMRSNIPILSLIKLILYFFKKGESVTNLLVSHSNYQYSKGVETFDRVLENQIVLLKENKEKYLIFNLENSELKLGSDLVVKLDFLFFFAKLCALIISFFAPLINPLICRNSKIFSANFGKIISARTTDSKNLMIKFYYLRLCAFFFRYVLKKHCVGRVDQALYYDLIGLAINKASGELGILRCVHQHGGWSDHNPAFGRWTRAPSSGYLLLPQRFYCWDEFSAKVIKTWHKRVAKLHYPLVNDNSFRRMCGKDYCAFDNRLPVNIRSAGMYDILYTMQPSVTVGLHPAVQAMLGKLPPDARMWVKLHPRQCYPEYIALIEKMLAPYSKVYLVSDNATPLAALMRYMNLHITAFSSSVYEAEAHSVKTIFLDELAGSYFRHIINDGHAVILNEHESLTQLVTQVIKLSQTH